MIEHVVGKEQIFNSTLFIKLEARRSLRHHVSKGTSARERSIVATVLGFIDALPVIT